MKTLSTMVTMTISIHLVKTNPMIIFWPPTAILITMMTEILILMILPQECIMVIVTKTRPNKYKAFLLHLMRYHDKMINPILKEFQDTK